MKIINLIKILFWVCGFLIFWAMFGYRLSLVVIDKLKKNRIVQKTNKKYTVTVMIVAHNEEQVIMDKLMNVINNDYPKEKIRYLVASDNSDDRTNQIVQDFISKHPELDIMLYITKEHKGKTNAQNEAQKMVATEILVMTDANSMFEENAISELVSSFSEEEIVYVCGKLQYINSGSATAGAETSYWDGDLKQRYIESSIKTITAGNGAIYACRNNEYIQIPLIECHDLSMPYYFATHGKRAIFNPDAIAYEKAGEVSIDEFKRKVRMNRGIFTDIKNGIKVINIFKYGWFSYFYFGHRTVRYLLWLLHTLVFALNVFLLMAGYFWQVILGLQILFYFLGFLGRNGSSKILYMIYYYCMTIVAQWAGVINILTGKAKPTWESVESTR